MRSKAAWASSEGSPALLAAIPGCCWRTKLFAERIAHFLAHWSFRVIAGFREDQAVVQRCSRASPNWTQHVQTTRAVEWQPSPLLCASQKNCSKSHTSGELFLAVWRWLYMDPVKWPIGRRGYETFSVWGPIWHNGRFSMDPIHVLSQIDRGDVDSRTHQTEDIQIRWSERMMFPALWSTVASAASSRRVKMRVSHPTDISSPGQRLMLIPSDLPLEKDARISWPLNWILQLG